MKVSIGKIEGSEVGVISASYVASRAFHKDFFNDIRNMFGLELKTYTSMLDNARDEVIKRMINKAQILGADSLCDIRFEISYMASGTLAIMGYATAVISK